MKKLLTIFSFIAYLAVATYAANVSAAVLDFGTGLAGSGGTIDDVNGDGSYITGADINLGSFEAVGTSADAVYVADAVLSFDTEANEIYVIGTIDDLGITTSITLLSGSFTDWTYDDATGSIVSFSGSGIDTKHPDLLTALGLPLDTQFDFFAFTLGFDTSADPATAISSDIINTSVVPVPAAVWLFGSGLLGLAAVARRRI